MKDSKKPSKALIKAYKPLVDACIVACISVPPLKDGNTAYVHIKVQEGTTLPAWFGQASKVIGDVRVFRAWRLLERLHEQGLTRHTYKEVMESRYGCFSILRKTDKLLDIDNYFEYYDGLLTNEEKQYD